MKEIIIKYKDSRVLELLKSLAVHFNFSISEKQELITKKSPDKETRAKDFVNQWAGFLKVPDTDRSKYDYLSQKYK
jgi:hypothetical protein